MSHVKRDCECPRVKHQHGTLRAYLVDGCRCFPCRTNCSRRRAEYKATGSYGETYAWASGVGVARRLQALSAIGYPDTSLAARLGVDKNVIIRLRAGKFSKVKAETHAAIARLYDELWERKPSHRFAERTRKYARRMGWVPPFAWDDDEIDDPNARPHLPESAGWNHKPCGTLAAVRRHYRNGEPLDYACARANRLKQDVAA